MSFFHIFDYYYYYVYTYYIYKIELNIIRCTNINYYFTRIKYRAARYDQLKFIDKLRVPNVCTRDYI